MTASGQRDDKMDTFCCPHGQTSVEAEWHPMASSGENFVKVWASSVLEEFVASISCLEDLGSTIPPKRR
jgi:hypothetical protein